MSEPVNHAAAGITTPQIGRRRALAGLGGLALGGLAATAASAARAAPTPVDEDVKQPAEIAARNGRIRQSVVHWCFKKHWDVDRACQVSKSLGALSVELVAPEDWPTLKKHGLTCAIAPSHGFERGMNNPKYQPECMAKIRKAVDDCAEAGFPTVITFTGFREDIPDDVGLENCVRAFKEVVGHAEAKKVTLCLEMLNSRVNEEMKGHPGYQGNHTDYCMEIIKRVSSPRLKLLFDIYHVQIMDGDIIRRIRQYHDWIGHYHTAGNPGRCEIDGRQEINYRPIIDEIARTGYQGFVGQEFIPTIDPLVGLKQAVEICDV